MSAGPPEDIAIRLASCLTDSFRYFCGLGRQFSLFPIPVWTSGRRTRL